MYWPYENKKIIEAEPVYTVAPEYSGFEGIAMVAGIIDTQGNVAEVRTAESTDSSLAEPTEKAAKQWKFKPALLEGKPVNYVFTVTFRFHKAMR